MREVGEVVCSSGGAASSDDNPKALQTSIESTVVANAVYKPLDVYVQYYWYDVYRNLSIEKRYPFGSGKVGVVGTSKRQLGAFYWQGLSASYIVDDLNIKQVRDARIGLSYQYRW